MKKLLLLIMSFLFCIGVSAKVNYSQATNISNDYIKNFPNYQRFIVTKNSSYGFNTSSKIVNAANFKTGGLINEQEFKVSSGSINRSYLFNGLTFFTMTEDGSNVKVIDPKVGSGITSVNKAAGTSGVRVTNYVMKDVKVDGNGTRVSPWRFVDRYNVKFEYDDTKLTVRPGTATVPRGGWVEVDVIESAKYTYVPQTTCGVITNGKLRVTGITGDTTCEIDHTLREYTVTLDSGEGTFKNTVSTSLNYTLSESNTKATKKITYQTAIGTLPGASHVERIGYTLQEWLNGTTPVNASLKITEDTNLTANWKANEYTVTYNISCGTVSPSTITVTYDSKYGKEKSLDTPTNCTGYSFAGWYLDSGFGTRVTDDTIVSTPSNHTLYGKWSANTYTVTYNANGGSGTMQNSTPVFDDDFVTRKNTFTRSGFTFDGWNEASDGSGTKWTLTTPGVYEYENGSHKIKWTRAENVTLYAQWLKNVTTVTEANYCANPTYNGSDQSIVKAAATGFKWSSNIYKNAGSYTAIATLDPGYIWTDGSKGTKQVTCEIKKKATTITVTKQTVTYDGNVHTASGTADSGQTVSFEYYTNSGCTTATSTSNGASASKGAPKDAGTYYVNASTTTNTNYLAGSKGCTEALVINAKSISVSWGTVTWTYDGSEHSTTASTTTGISSETMTLAISNNSITYKGTKSVTASCSSVSGGRAKCANYSLTNASNTLTISERKVTVTASNQSKTYDGTALNADSTCTAEGLVSGHTVTCSNTGSQTAAGSSTKTLTSVTIKDGSGNNVSSSYGITMKNGTLTVNKASSSITCNTLTYTGSEQTLATGSGCSSLSNNKRTAAGSQTVTCTGDSNHNDLTKSCSIGKAASSITCNTLTYSGSEQTLATGSGCSSLSNNKRTAAGSQTVTCTGDSNHNDSTKSCSIGKAASSITCNNPTYGSGTAIASCSGGTISNPPTNVGSFSLTCTGDANHNDSTKTCAISPSKTATLGSCGTVYYDASPHTLAGGGSHVSYSNNTQTQVGTHTVTATADTNYLFADGDKTKTLKCEIKNVPANCKVLGGILKCCTTGYTAFVSSNGNDIDCKISCSDGYHLATANGSTCTACGVGTYTEANTIVYGGTSPCLQCRPGYYNNKTAQKACTPCDAGDYASGYGNTSCDECGAGTYSNSGASGCTQCDAGYYASGTGNSSCSPCPSGKTSSKGSASCSWICNVANCSRCSAKNYCSSCKSGYTASGGKCTSNSGGGSSGGGGCFPQGTKVMTKKGPRNIEEIVDGTFVLTYNEETGKQEYNRVKHHIIINNPGEILYTLRFDDGSSLKITHLHKVYVIRDNEAYYIKAEDLKRGDKVLSANESIKEIRMIISESYDKPVYNLEVENTHNFYVGNNPILVHNVAINFLAVSKDP